jgi:hypothetical protein
MAEFFKSASRRAISNLHFYAIDGEVALDHVLRYEKLAEEVELLSRKLSLGSSLQLPRAKSDTRKDRRPYSEVLGPTERGIIARRCAREIELLGYEF